MRGAEGRHGSDIRAVGRPPAEAVRDPRDVRGTRVYGRRAPRGDGPIRLLRSVLPGLRRAVPGRWIPRPLGKALDSRHRAGHEPPVPRLLHPDHWRDRLESGQLGILAGHDGPALTGPGGLLRHPLAFEMET